MAGAGCVSTTIEGAKEPPTDWAMVSSPPSCEAFSGIFEAVGEPALENANTWLYGVMWPARGSLATILQTSANGVAPSDVGGVRIDIDVYNQMRFTALNAQGRIHKVLDGSRWACREGQLISSTELSPAVDSGNARDRIESQVRIWLAEDGSLIAENTILLAGQSYLRSKELQPNARFYFRFRLTSATR